MRTLNVPLAAIVTAVALLSGSGLFFLHRYQVRRNAYVFKHESELLEGRAKEAAKKRDNRAAAIAYRNAIKNLAWYVRLAPTR